MNGEAPLEILTIPDFQLGSYKVHDIEIPALSNHRLQDGVFGLIGMNLLSEFDVELNVANGSVNLFTRGSCPGRQVYWSADFSTVDVSFVSSTDRSLRLPVTLNGVQLTALLDSGAAMTVVDKDTASHLGYDPSAPNVIHLGQASGLNGKKVDVDAYRFDSFSIADEKISHPLLEVTRMYGVKDVIAADVILGLDFIKAHRIYIDNEGGHIYFNYLGGPIFEHPRILANRNTAASKEDLSNPTRSR